MKTKTKLSPRKIQSSHYDCEYFHSTPWRRTGASETIRRMTRKIKKKFNRMMDKIMPVDDID